MKPDEAGFYVGREIPKELRYHVVPNPRISAQPIHLLRGLSDLPGAIRALTRPFTEEGEAIDFVAQHEAEFLVAFDLRNPIRPQIENVERMLNSFQAEWFEEAKARRHHPKKWSTYLRVLDAREAGASWSEIAEILSHTAGTEQTARDTWDQANALCFNSWLRV